MTHREGIIYLITNAVNGKRYVGQTVRGLENRWKYHLNDANDGSPYLIHRAIRKYGPDAFTVEVIATSLSSFLDVLEAFYVRLYNTHSKYGYNLTEGGDGVKGHTWEWTEEQKRDHSHRMKGMPHLFKPRTEAEKQAISSANKGKKRSTESCQRMRKSRLAYYAAKKAA